MNDGINSAIKNIHLEAKRGSFVEGKLVIKWKNIKEECLKIAERLLIETNQNESPISLEPVCELRRIRVFQSTSPHFDFQGEIIPDNEGFMVNLNSDHSDTRKRATLAHEIGHSLFYDISKLPPKRVYRNIDSKEEWICWDFARSLLLPRWSILNFLSHNKETPKPQIIYETTKKYNVSVDLLLKRIRWDFDCWTDSTFFVGSFKNGRFIVNKDNIHKGLSDDHITIMGEDGLLNKSDLKTLILFLSINHNINYIEKKINVNNNSFWVELLRYNNNPSNILGIIKTRC
jgi:Zn-dependent peptidase ImmA (M78 family)